MKKEVLLVILTGVILGAVIAYGVYTARTAIRKQQEKTPPPPETQAQIQPTPQPSHFLTIIDPQPDSIHQNEELTVTGTTSPDAVITIITPENEYLLSADAQGNFSASVTLVGGANTLSVTAFDEQGNRAQQSLTVVYSTVEI